jgi:hypothetical protein
VNDDTKFAKAHQAIGKYFAEFSELERELGEAVKVVVDLEKHDAANIVVDLLRYPRTKAELVRGALQITTKKKDGTKISTKWKARAHKTLGTIIEHNNACRDYLAHSHLEPLENGSVKVTRGSKGQRKPENWNLQTKIDEVRRLTKALREIRIELSKLEVIVGKIHWVEALFRDDPGRYLGYDDKTQTDFVLRAPVAGSTKRTTAAKVK